MIFVFFHANTCFKRHILHVNHCVVVQGRCSNQKPITATTGNNTVSKTVIAFRTGLVWAALKWKLSKCLSSITFIASTSNENFGMIHTCSVLIFRLEKMNSPFPWSPWKIETQLTSVMAGRFRLENPNHMIHRWSGCTRHAEFYVSYCRKMGFKQ